MHALTLPLFYGIDQIFCTLEPRLGDSKMVYLVGLVFRIGWANKDLCSFLQNLYCTVEVNQYGQLLFWVITAFCFIATPLLSNMNFLKGPKVAELPNLI